MPTTEIRPAWETSAFPDWVNYTFIPLFTAGESWPVDTKAVELGRAAQLFDSMADNLGGAVEKTVPAVSAINAGYTSPAKPPAFTYIRRQFDDRTGVIAKANQGAQFAEHFASFALETDLTKRSINIAFWVSVTAAALGIVAVSSPFAALVVRLSARMGSVRAQLLMRRLLLVASRVGPATGGRTLLAGSAAGRYAQWEIMTELPEEIAEELASEKAQYDQIKEGLRDKWDWRRTKAILIGTVIGTVSGVWIGRHMRGHIDRLPGIRSLNRMAGDRTGVLPALQRYPGAVLATALPNVPGSMLGQVGAGLAVYGTPGQFTLESMVGSAAAGGFRANTYSPFNLQVMGAAVHPISTLSNYAASVGTHLAGTGTATTAPAGGPDGSGPPAAGGQPSAGGPRPTGPDGAAAQMSQPVVPLHRAVSDLSGPTTRDGTDVTQQRSPAADPQRTPTADPSKPHRQTAPDQPAATAQAERNATAPASPASPSSAAQQPGAPDQRANGQRTADQAQPREPAPTQDERQAPPPAQTTQPQNQAAQTQSQAQAASSPNAQVQSQTTAEPNTAPGHTQTAQNGHAAPDTRTVQNTQVAAGTVIAAVSPVTVGGQAAVGPSAADPAVARLGAGAESRSDHALVTAPGQSGPGATSSAPETPIGPNGREEGDEALRRGRRIAAELDWGRLPDRVLRQVGEVQALYETTSRTHDRALRNAEFELGGRRGVYATARRAALANDAGVRQALDDQDPNALTSALVQLIRERDVHLTIGHGTTVLAKMHGLTDQELRAIGRLDMRFGLLREGALDPAMAGLIRDRGLANTLEAYLDLERKGAYSSLDRAEDPVSWLAAYLAATGEDRLRLVGSAVGRIGHDPYPEDSWVHLGRLAEIAGPELFGGRLRSFRQHPLDVMASSGGLLRIIDKYLDAVRDGYRPVIDATTPDQLAEALRSRPPARQASERDIRALLDRDDAMSRLARELSMTPWLVEQLLWAAHERGQLGWEADGILRHGRFTETIAGERLMAVRPELADRWLGTALANALGHELAPDQIRALAWVARARDDIRTPEDLRRRLEQLADVAGLPASPDSTPAVLDAIIQGHGQGTVPLRPSWDDLRTGLRSLGEPLRPRSADLDPDTRPPLLALHDDQDLAALRDGDAYAIDPRRALRASQWAGLRRFPGETVKVRGTWNTGLSSLEVRRMDVLDEVGKIQPITEFTLVLRVKAPALSRAELLREQSNILDAVDLYFNHQHRLRDGSQLHLRVEFVQVRRGRSAVLLRPDAGKRSDAAHFDAGKQLSFYAHELGHHLGLPDEYREEDRDGRRTMTDSYVRLDRTLMGPERLFWTFPQTSVRGHQGLWFPASVGLRRRHLEALSDLAAITDVPGGPRTETRPRDLPVITGPASPAVPDETTRLPVPTAENTRLPDHVLELLKNFPVSGPEFFQHALRLDRMAALHQGVPIADLAQHHLAYTDALISTATAMYATRPDYWFTTAELTRLRSLLELVADRDGVPPDAHTVTGRVAEAMGIDQPRLRDLEGLARFAEWFRATGGQRFPGEQGVRVLRRAAGELFGDVESTRAVVEVAHLFATAAESSAPIAFGEAGSHFGIVAAAIRDALAARGPGEKLTGSDLARVVQHALIAARAPDRVKRGEPAGPDFDAGFAGVPDGAVAFHGDPNRPDPAGRRAQDAPTRAEREIAVRPIGDWFVADGRQAVLDDLTVAEARAIFDADVEPADFGSRSMTWRWVDDTTLLIGGRHIAFEVGPIDGDALGRVRPRSGTAQDPDRAKLPPRLAPDQVAPAVLAAVSDVFQMLTAPSTTLAALTGHPDGRDASHNARQNIFRLLSRRFRSAKTPEAGADLRARLDAILASFAEGVPIGAGGQRLDRLRALAEPPPAPAPATQGSATRGPATPVQAMRGPVPPRSADLDPDTRPALLPLHDDRTLAVLRDRNAHSIDPRRALRASQWARLRQYPGQEVKERHPWERSRSRLEVRSLQVVDEAGATHAVTEFTLILRFAAHPSMSAAELLHEQSNMLDAVDVYYNHQHRLRDGSQLHLRLRFVPAEGDEPRVVFHPRTPGARPNAENLYAGWGLALAAHELGHHLGFDDEYMEAAKPDRRTLAGSRVRRDPSFMGSERLWWAEDAVSNLDGSPFSARVGPRHRHLMALSDLAETMEVTVIRRPGALDVFPARTEKRPRGLPIAKGPAEPAVPYETMRPAMPTADSIRLPEHVRELLASFPAHGREFFDHVLRLERMAAMHREVTIPDLTRHHLVYTDALISTVAAMYGTSPDFPFRGADLRRVRALVELVADQDGAVPRPHAFLRQVAEAMGRDRLTVGGVDGLARFVEWFRFTGGQRFPGEQGVAALRRAAGELFGDLGSTEAVVKVAQLFAAAAEHSPHIALGHAGDRFATVAERIGEALAARAPGQYLSGYDLATLVEESLAGAVDDTRTPGTSAPRQAEASPPGTGPSAQSGRQYTHDWLPVIEYDQLVRDLRELQAAAPELIRRHAPDFDTRPEGVVVLRAFTAGHGGEINAAIRQGLRPDQDPIAGAVAEMWAAWRQLPRLDHPVSFWLDLTPHELGGWTTEPEFMLNDFMLVTAQPAHPATRVPEGRIRYRFDFDVANARELGPITWQAGLRQVLAEPGTRLSVTYVAEERRIVLSDGHTAPPPALTSDGHTAPATGPSTAPARPDMRPDTRPAAQGEVSRDDRSVRPLIPPPSAPRPGRGADDWVASTDAYSRTLRLYRRLPVSDVLSVHIADDGSLFVLRGADWYLVEQTGGLRLHRVEEADLTQEMADRARQRSARHPAAAGTLYGFNETMYEEPGQRSMRHRSADVIATFYNGYLGSLHVPMRDALPAPLLTSAIALGTLTHPATGRRGVRVENGWMRFTVLEDASVVDAEVRPVDLTPELVGLRRTEVVSEPAGFIRGGVNDNAIIAGLDRFGATSRAEFEQRLREAGLLGSTEDVREVLVRDNTLVLRAKLTHHDLAQPLRLAAHVLRYVDRARIRLGGHAYDLRTVRPSGAVTPDTVVEVVNVTTGERLTFDPGIAEMVSSHGFYGGRRSPARLSPEQIIQVFTHLNERLPDGHLRQLIGYTDRDLERPAGEVVVAAVSTPPDARAPELPALPEPTAALPAGLRPLGGRFAGSDNVVIEFGDGGRGLFTRLGEHDAIARIHVERRSARAAHLTVEYRAGSATRAGWFFTAQGMARSSRVLLPDNGFVRPSERKLRDLGFQPLIDEGRLQIMRFTHGATTVLAVLDGRRLTGLYSSVPLTPSQQRLVDVATIRTDAEDALGLDVNGLRFDLEVRTGEASESHLINAERSFSDYLNLELPPVSSSESGGTVVDEAARIERSLRRVAASPAHLPGFQQLGVTPIWQGGPFVVLQRPDSSAVLYRQVTDATPPEDLQEVNVDGVGPRVRAGADATLAITVDGQGEILYQRVSPPGTDLIGGTAEGVRLADALVEWTVHPEEPHVRDLVVHAGLDTIKATLDAASTSRLDDVRELERRFAHQVTEGWRSDVPGVLRHDDHLVRVEGATHAQLATPLRLIRFLDDALPGFDRVTMGGQKYAVRRETPLFPLRSPFGDLLDYSPDYVVTNLIDGTELRFAGRAGDLIAAHGFYGDNTYLPRLNPQDIKIMFPSVLPSDAGISGLLPGTAAEPRLPGGGRLGASAYWRGLSRLVMHPDDADPVLYLKRELNFSRDPVRTLEVDPSAEGGPVLRITTASYIDDTYLVPMGDVRASTRTTPSLPIPYSQLQQPLREQLENAGFHVVHAEDDLRILRYAWSGGEMLAVFVGEELDGFFSRDQAHETEAAGTSNRIDRLINAPRWG